MTVSAYTPNFKLALIDFNSQNWHGDAWDNLLLIDAILKADFTDVPYGNAAGTNTITVDVTPNVTAYVSGLTVLFKLANAPTGTATLNVDGLGAKALKIAGADIVAGDLLASDVVRAIYDGTNFNVVEPLRVFAKLRITVGAGSGATPAATADDLVLDADVSGGISILSPTTGIGSINFGDSGNSSAGTIVYNHNTDKLIYTAVLGHSFVGSVAVTGAVSTTGAITQAGNQVWHAGNLTPTDYMPKSGGTFTNVVTFTGPSELAKLANASPAIAFYNAAGTTRFGYIQHSGAGSDITVVNDQAATIILQIQAVQRVVVSATGAAVIGTLSATGAITQGGNQVWHAGNLTIANYATLASPTFTGTVVLPSTTTMGGTAVLRTLSGTTGGRVKIQAQSGADYTGFVDNDFSFEY